MTYSLWDTAEALMQEGGAWLIDGPWVDANNEDTLESALEYLESCCETVVQGYGDEDDDDWYRFTQDELLLEHLLTQLEPDHKWYNELKELYFMAILATA